MYRDTYDTVRCIHLPSHGDTEQYRYIAVYICITMYHDVSRYIDTTRYTDTHVSPPLSMRPHIGGLNLFYIPHTSNQPRFRFQAVKERLKRFQARRCQFSEEEPCAPKPHTVI